MNHVNEQAYARVAALSSGQRVGSLFTTPGEVHDAVVALDNEMDATEHQWELAALGNASNSATFFQAAANDYPAWSAFRAGWNSFALTAGNSFLTASSEMDRVTDYTTQLAQWQATLTKDTSGTVKPTTPAVALTNSGGAIGNAAQTLGQAAQTGTSGEAKAAQNLLTPVIEIGVLAIVGYLAIEFLPVLAKRYA